MNVQGDGLVQELSSILYCRIVYVYTKNFNGTQSRYDVLEKKNHHGFSFDMFFDS